MKYQELREQICDVCHKMWQLGWVAANDGNVSVKLPDGNFMATPTGSSKSFITPEKLVIINENGEVVEGEEGYKPSSEIKMHLRCYKEREDVGAVVHTHPPTATGYAVAGKSLDEYSMDRVAGFHLLIYSVKFIPHKSKIKQLSNLHTIILIFNMFDKALSMSSNARYDHSSEK